MAIPEVHPFMSEARTRQLMRIRELDPRERCGSGTTVSQLYLVDRMPNDPQVRHLVFLDRHGWYCVHGRDCPAVHAAQEGTRQQRTHDGTADNASALGWTRATQRTG